MSLVSVTCTHCQAKFSAKPQLAGKRVKCPKCGGPIDVPKSPSPGTPVTHATSTWQCSMCLTDFEAAAPTAGGDITCPLCGMAVAVGGSGSVRGAREPVRNDAEDPLGLSKAATLPPARLLKVPALVKRFSSDAPSRDAGLMIWWPSAAVAGVALLSFMMALFTHRLTHGVVLLVAGLFIAGVGVVFPPSARRPRAMKNSWIKSAGSAVGVAVAVMGWLLIQARREGRSARFMGYFVAFMLVVALLVGLVAGYVWAVIRYGFFRPTAVVYGLFALGLPALWIAVTPQGFNTASLPSAVDVRSESLPSFPELGPAREVEMGVSLRECRLSIAAGRPGYASKILVYTPTGAQAARSLPCVFIVGAGAVPFTGMELGDTDSPEQTPYVHAGFAVVAYEIDGYLPESELWSDQRYLNAVEKYWAAHAGIVNARNAIEFALAKVPEIDPARLYTAGHSSAAVQALLLAANDSRIRACVAYAPVSDWEEHSDELVGNLRQTVSGFDNLLQMASPRANEAKLNCPVLLFHALDDSNVPVNQSMDMAARLRGAGKQVKLVTVPTGDHYDSMISQGIPQGIAWLSQLAGVAGIPFGPTAESDISADPAGPIPTIPTNPFGPESSVPTGPSGPGANGPPDPFGPGPNRPTYPAEPNSNGMPSLPRTGYGGPSGPGPDFGGPPGPGPGYGGPSRPMPPTGPRMPGRRR